MRVKNEKLEVVAGRVMVEMVGFFNMISNRLTGIKVLVIAG